MEIIQDILGSIFRVDSIWSVVIRAVIWFVIAAIIIISVDNPDTDKSMKDLKSNLGFFLMFLILSGGLIFMLFSYQAA